MDPGRRAAEYHNWRRAVERSFDWTRTGPVPAEDHGPT
jgi:glycerol kinase